MSLTIRNIFAPFAIVFATAFYCELQRVKGPTIRISHSAIVQIHVALIGNPAAESFGQPLNYSDGCKSGLVAVDEKYISAHRRSL